MWCGEGMGWCGFHRLVKGGHRGMLWICMGFMSTPNPKARLPTLDTKQEARQAPLGSMGWEGQQGSSLT